MNIEEARRMRGTEFIYIFSDGDRIQAYVKEFDAEVGLSCWSLGLVSEQQHEFETNEPEEDGICLIGHDFNHIGSLNRALTKLEEIKQTGYYFYKSGIGAFCPF